MVVDIVSPDDVVAQCSNETFFSAREVVRCGIHLRILERSLAQKNKISKELAKNPLS